MYQESEEKVSFSMSKLINLIFIYLALLVSRGKY